jgi:predicted GNAT superfamily acetyltransferase
MAQGGQAEQIVVLRATREHLPQIVELAESRSLEGVPPENRSAATAGGFLVSAYTEADYRARLETAEHFHVAVKGDKVLGFLLAYSSDRVEPGEWLNRRIKDSLGDYLVIKQVCVAGDAARAGIGSQLYHHVLDRWQGSPVMAAVVNEPPNTASSRFHRKLGFEELTRLTPPDGMQRVVWVRRKPREAVLASQYDIAVDLYKHEDSLNWQKLSNFFYITVGLSAAMVLCLGKEGVGGPVGEALGMVLCVIGLGVSLGFSAMLFYGREYLLARKAAVIALEDHLTWHGGQRIVAFQSSEPDKRYLKVSPTAAIMVGLPVLVAVGWGALLAVLVGGAVR